MSLETRPKSVAIVGLGPSVREYLNDSFRKKGLFHVDETWGVNTAHRVFNVDKIWMMDDLKNGIGHNYPDWANELRLEKTPIITCRQYDEFPSSVAYPIDQVEAYFRNDYFSTTISYMIAYAIYIKVETLYLYGIDFYYPNAQIVESGLGGVSYWLGRAEERGIKYKIPSSSTLLDAHLVKFEEENGVVTRAKRLKYGYDYNPQDAKRQADLGSDDPAVQAIAQKSYQQIDGNRNVEAK